MHRNVLRYYYGARPFLRKGGYRAASGRLGGILKKTVGRYGYNVLRNPFAVIEKHHVVSAQAFYPFKNVHAVNGYGNVSGKAYAYVVHRVGADGRIGSKGQRPCRCGHRYPHGPVFVGGISLSAIKYLYGCTLKPQPPLHVGKPYHYITAGTHVTVHNITSAIIYAKSAAGVDFAFRKCYTFGEKNIKQRMGSLTTNLLSGAKAFGDKETAVQFRDNSHCR